MYLRIRRSDVTEWYSSSNNIFKIMSENIDDWPNKAGYLISFFSLSTPNAG